MILRIVIRQCNDCGIKGVQGGTFVYMGLGTWSCNNCGNMWTTPAEIKSTGYEDKG